VNIPIWPGSSSFSPGKTPFGYYDYDSQFQLSVDRVADWCAKRLGYPIMEVELQDLNFYTAFEEAITEFATQVNMSNAKDNMHMLIGSSTSNELSGRVIKPNMGRAIELAKMYGSEAGSGGNVDWKKGYIELQPGIQNYDLNTLWANPQESSASIEIKRIYHDFTPAIVRYFDPYVGTGAGTQQLLDSFGWGSYSPSVSFLIMPIYADLLRMQAIELNDTIRKSSFTFELRNNKLRIFPIPSTRINLWFDYIKVADRNNPLTDAYPTGSVSDLSNIPYNRIPYGNIKDIGVQWIYKYTLAICKEMLGLIRSKYSSVPIPGAETTLNGADLVAQGREDKTNLVTELKELLQGLTRQGQTEQEAAVATSLQQQLNKVPLSIYIK
jgi:hypothetical protein